MHFLLPLLRSLFFAMIVLVATPSPYAQVVSDTTTNIEAEPVSEQPVIPPAKTCPPTASAKQKDHRLARWFELQTALLYLRYRFVENSAKVTTANQLQHKETFKARLKLDRCGRYSINAGVFSGRNFVSTWNNTGLGTGQAQSNLALKQLYVSAMPVDGVELQYGGLYILRGDSTEITTYDDDGFIMGERISLKRPDKLFFDEISATYAYLGDINIPNIDKRYHELKHSNYHQFLVEKKLGKRVAFSADYTFEAGRETLREAIKLNTPESHFLDNLRFENYERVRGKQAYGFAIQAEKTIAKRLTLSGGYVKIDFNYGNLNADRFLTGKRLFLMSNLILTPEFSVLTYMTRALANPAPVTLRTRVDLILNYNLLKGLQHTGLF